MRQFFQQLKRRNVFRVGVGYLVVGWLLAQVAATLENALNLPHWFDTTIVAALLIGLPVALLLAWAYDVTPDGVKPGTGAPATPARLGGRRLNMLIIAGLVVALGYFVWERQTPSPQVPGAGEIGIAVLPFADLSEAGDQAYLGDGVAEEILNVLAGLDGLKVTSRTSAFAFSGRNLSIPEIARLLGVSHVVEGSIRKQGERVRVTAQLIDVSNDSHLWSHTYDAELSDIFALQDEIANKISAALSASFNLALPTVDRQTPSWDIAAYELYLRARRKIALRGVANTTEAATLLKAALAIEPDFADAWAELAAAESLTGFFLSLNKAVDAGSAARYTAAWDAGARAVALDAKNSLGVAVQGVVRFYQGRPIEARILLERAVAVGRPVTSAFLWLGILQAQTGAIDDALATFGRALEIDPTAPNIHRWMGITLGIRRQFAAAQPHNRIAADLNIVGSRSRWLTYEVLLGRADIGALKDPDVPGNILFRPKPEQEHILLALRGVTEAAARHELIAREAEIDITYRMLFTLVQTGPDDLANRLLIRQLERPYSSIRGILAAISWNPGQSDFRKSEAFHDYVRASGMDRYWAIYGWPKQCHPLGGEKFACE